MYENKYIDTRKIILILHSDERGRERGGEREREGEGGRGREGGREGGRGKEKTIVVVNEWPNREM